MACVVQRVLAAPPEQYDAGHHHNDDEKQAKEIVATLVPQVGIAEQQRQAGDQRDFGIEALHHGIGQGGYGHHAEGEENRHGVEDMPGLGRHQHIADRNRNGSEQSGQAPTSDMAFGIVDRQALVAHPALVPDHRDTGGQGHANPEQQCGSIQSSPIENHGKHQRRCSNPQRITGRMAKKGFDTDQMNTLLNGQLASRLAKTRQRQKVVLHAPPLASSLMPIVLRH